MAELSAFDGIDRATSFARLVARQPRRLCRRLILYGGMFRKNERRLT